MLKILHTGDIHLDTPFSSLDMRRSEIRRSELRAAFTSMMVYARMNNVDIILIAGDLFDNSFATHETVALIKREFENVPDCKIIISPGNHDPYNEKSVYSSVNFPDNVYIFSENQLGCFEFEELGCDIYGYAFTSKSLETNPLLNKRAIHPERMNILCGHAVISDSKSPYCPLTEKDLSDFGFDYAALGHVHNSSGIHRIYNGETQKETFYAHCGCLEGRDFWENGPKGAVLIEMEKTGGTAKLDIKPLRFSKRHYEVHQVSVEGMSSMAEIQGAVGSLINSEKYGEDTLLRVVLTGSVPPELVIMPDILKNSFKELFLLDVVDETVPAYNTDYLESDPTVKGEFYRHIIPVLKNGTPEEKEIAALALRYGLAAVSGENIIDI